MQILLSQSDKTSLVTNSGVTLVTFKRMHRRFDYYNSLERKKKWRGIEQITNS